MTYTIYKIHVTSLYNIDISSDLIYKFLWNILCDKWIEDSKKNSISITLNKIIEEFEPIFQIYYK